MKIIFVTFHNWKTKRIGGFHKLAEAAVKAGHEVVFFSFDRPYFIALKHDERLNKNVLKELSRGIEIKIDKPGNKLVNCTWPTLRIPEPFRRNLPDCVNRWFETHSLTPFPKFQKKFLEDTDVFVIESCEGIAIFDLLKKYNPKAKFVYRPSDPIMIDGCDERSFFEEVNILCKADLCYVVNKQGANLYRRKIPDFDSNVNYSILPNGVDTDLFKHSYPKPEVLKKDNTFLYVGARDAEWELIKEAARKRPDYNFIIVCPENPPIGFTEVPTGNITYIPGILPTEVPRYVTNADVIIVPNPHGRYKIKPWGITAKYYQAMEACKPIVAFDDTSELVSYGVFVAYDYDTFISMLDSALELKEIDYAFNRRDWSSITCEFLEGLKNLCDK